MTQVYPGQTFNSFTTIRPQRIGRYSGWLCRCACGTEKAIYTNKITSGKYKSCGCKRSENISKGVTKHGLTAKGIPAEYRIWRGIKTRCLNPKTRHFHRYGGRGISLFKEWIDDFEAFYNYVGPRPSKSHTIDRIDNNGDYEPGNVRWATIGQQANNRSTNIFVILDGKSFTAAQAAKILGVKRSTLYYRIKNDLPLSKEK